MRELEEKIVNIIKARGPITFRDFMHLALYDADYGYYTTPGEKIGRGGDYYTSANIDESFGALLAKQCVELQAELGVKRPLTIMEAGAGTGQLAADIITALEREHSLHDYNYLICEASPALAARQRERLHTQSGRVRWVSYTELNAAPMAGIVISNEVADALPVHRVKWQAGALRELFVDYDGARLCERWAAPSTDALGHYLRRLEIELVEEQCAEIGLDAVNWLGQLAAGLERGFIITIDYGDLADHLYLPDRLEGTLRCFYRHTVNDRPLERVGEQDITADVNFSALIEYGKDLGLEVVRLARQADYLIRLGLLDRLQQQMEAGAGDFASLKKRLALKNFFVPGGISDHFKVLVQSKQIP